jgi:hypothetical protein
MGSHAIFEGTKGGSFFCFFCEVRDKSKDLRIRKITFAARLLDIFLSCLKHLNSFLAVNLGTSVAPGRIAAKQIFNSFRFDVSRLCYALAGTTSARFPLTHKPATAFSF